MPLRVLIVPDKFKGTLTAHQAASAIERGWRAARPTDLLELLPMSDGGDGFGTVMAELLEARRLPCTTIDAAYRRCRAKWWWEPNTQTAIIETAAVVGLAMLPTKRFHPFELDTAGLASVVAAMQRRRTKSCLMGIGGSATNDGGFGMARALGWNFLDRNGASIERWIDLDHLESLDPPTQSRNKCETRFLVAVDVHNPLLGPRGATRVYGPQKGLTPKDFRKAEACLGRLAKVTARVLGKDFAKQPGTGAAGGLGFGLAAFLNAKLEPGFDLFARYASLKARINRADVVITGEGAVDASTLMGKGVGRVAEECAAAGVPCIAVAGRARLPRRNVAPFTFVAGMTELTSERKAIAEAALWLSRLSEAVARQALLNPNSISVCLSSR